MRRGYDFIAHDPSVTRSSCHLLVGEIKKISSVMELLEHHVPRASKMDSSLSEQQIQLQQTDPSLAQHGFQEIRVARALLRGQLESDVQELSEVCVELGVSGDVPNRTRKLVAAPLTDCDRGGKSGAINVDHRCIRSAKLLDVF